MDREKWLNGWHRDGGIVWMGHQFCAGCGRLLAVASFIIDTKLPDKEPDYPFNEGECPVCNPDNRGHLTPEDISKCSFETIRKAIEIKKIEVLDKGTDEMDHCHGR